MIYIVTVNETKQYKIESDSPEAAKEAIDGQTPISANQTINVRFAPQRLINRLAQQESNS